MTYVQKYILYTSALWFIKSAVKLTNDFSYSFFFFWLVQNYSGNRISAPLIWSASKEFFNWDNLCIESFYEKQYNGIFSSSTFCMNESNDAIILFFFFFVMRLKKSENSIPWYYSIGLELPQKNCANLIFDEDSMLYEWMNACMENG